MSDDRTTPMDQPQWNRRESAPDDKETVHADQQSITPPTLPVPDPGRPGWESPPEPDFVRTAPAEPPTPQPFQQPQPPYGPPGGPPAGPPAYQPPASGGEQTMLISQTRPSAVFAWLAVVDGPDRNAIGRVHSLQPGTTTLGRVQGNSIVLSDDTCSAQHARVRIEEREDQDPAFMLYDMGSSNGTFVGNRENHKNPESQTYRHELQDGDYILVGETSLVFKKI